MYMCMCVCVCDIFIHSSVDARLDCFPVLTIVNNAAMNIGIYVSFQVSGYFFSAICPGIEFLGHMVILFVVF